MAIDVDDVDPPRSTEQIAGAVNDITLTRLTADNELHAAVWQMTDRINMDRVRQIDRQWQDRNLRLSVYS